MGSETFIPLPTYSASEKEFVSQEVENSSGGGVRLAAFLVLVHVGPDGELPLAMHEVNFGWGHASNGCMMQAGHR